MDKKGFHTFFISREVSYSPLITDIIKFLKEFLIKEKCSISLSYGKRILINSETDALSIEKEDIVEIVDFDPIRNVALVIGKREPCIEAPIHWIIQKARNDVNAILYIKNKVIFERYRDLLPVVENKGIIELTKEILKELRENKCVLIKDQGLILVGFSLKDISDCLKKEAFICS